MASNCQTSPGNNQENTCQQIFNIFREVLGLEDVDLHATFLDLGGDSLSAMLCIARIRQLFGGIDLELSIEEFFMDQGTVAGIAMIVDQAKACSPTTDRHGSDAGG